MSEFERFLVAMNRRLNGQATTAEIVAAAVENFGEWREQVGRSELVGL